MERVILITAVQIYDGWCCRYFPDTDRFEWRTAWYTIRLPDAFKRKWEKDYRESMRQIEQDET